LQLILLVFPTIHAWLVLSMISVTATKV